MWVLKIRMDDASEEELQGALRAAEAVFVQKKVHPLAGMEGRCQLEGWDDRGCHDDDPDYTDEDARNALAWIDAEEAAILTLSKRRSFFDVSPVFEMTVVEIKENPAANAQPNVADSMTRTLLRRAA